VVFEQYDQPGIETDERGVFDAGRFRAAWVTDPDGNTLAITEVSFVAVLAPVRSAHAPW
jgi:hypothetical protein